MLDTDSTNRHAKRDQDHDDEAVLVERSGSMRISIGSTGFSRSSSQRNVERSYSSGRISSTASLRRSSISLSRNGSNRMFEDVPSDIIAQAGDSGDRVMDDSSPRGCSAGVDESVRIGRKQYSFGRMSGRGSQWNDSTSFSQDLEDGIPEVVESQIVTQAGDSGSRVAQEDKSNRSGSLRFELDNMQTFENRIIPVSDDSLVQSNVFQSCNVDGTDYVSPLPTDAIHSKAISLNRLEISHSFSLEEKQYMLPRPLDYMFYLITLAVLGILGVITRYLLQKLFGPGLLALTGDQTLLYLDLPSNMAGSFLMGWFGVVFKGDVCHISDHLAIGLTTGYLGSLTTFSGWNQKMLDLSSSGHWVFAVAGIVLGLFLVNESINVGVESAEWFRGWLLGRLDQSSESTTCILGHWRVNSPKRHTMFMTVMVMILVLLWGLSGDLFRTKWDHATDGTILWLGCLVGPPGVWARWHLARLNGQGLGKKGLLKWVPIGTLAANVLAACIMAALATISKAVNTKRCSIIVSGVQFGFMGCLSTVSTFAAEVYAMRKNGHPGRALAYAAATFIISFALGTLIYSLPVWTKHYH